MLVTYLDLLGFGHFIRTDFEAATKLLADYMGILSFHRKSAEGFFSALADVERNRRPHSFHNFIPFSDSIFITAEPTDAFFEDLGRFLYDAFDYSAGDQADIAEGGKLHARRTTELVNDGDGIKSEEVEIPVFPVLFRGGIAWGNAKIAEIPAISEGAAATSRILWGESVVDAVALEQSGVHGPRILVSREAYNEVSAEYKTRFVPLPDSPSVYEFLWPAVRFDPSDVRMTLQNDYERILRPSVTLWKFCAGKRAESTYWNLVSLVVRSAFSLFGQQHATQVADFTRSLLTRLAVENTVVDRLIDWRNFA